MARIVVMGAGLGGMAAAYELRETLGKAHHVSVVGLGDRFSFTPSNPWLAVGWRTPGQITLDAGKHLGDKGIAFHGSGAQRIDAEARQVHTGDGEVLDYDFKFLMQFWDCPKPTIAAVHGFCLAGAFEMALSCDVTVAAEGTRFGEPEVRFGSGIVAMLLPWVVGPKAAKELLLTGNDKVDAARALQLGIVNHVVPAGQELEKALDIARDMAAAAPLSVEMTKRAINRTYEMMNMRQALLAALDIDTLIEAGGGPERAEFNRIRKEQGLKAAIEWRDARFKRAG